jgi:hypothetical protein
MKNCLLERNKTKILLLSNGAAFHWTKKRRQLFHENASKMSVFLLFVD